MSLLYLVTSFPLRSCTTTKMTLIGGRHSNWVKALSIELAFLLSPTDDIKKEKGREREIKKNRKRELEREKIEKGEWKEKRFVRRSEKTGAQWSFKKIDISASDQSFSQEAVYRWHTPVGIHIGDGSSSCDRSHLPPFSHEPYHLQATEGQSSCLHHRVTLPTKKRKKKKQEQKRKIEEKQLRGSSQ